MASEVPPSYYQATNTGSNTPGCPQIGNGIPPQRRHSTKNEARPLPQGWKKQYDQSFGREFFVDTNARPPRSIWHHPFDDEAYLAAISGKERERIEEINCSYARANFLSVGSNEELHKDYENSGTGSKMKMKSAGVSTAATETIAAAAGGGASVASSSAPKAKGLKQIGRSLKDKMTGTTHEQREAERRERDLQEQQEYEAHQRIQAAMVRAMETGQPQHVGKDRGGKDVYIEPPSYGPYGPYPPPGVYYGGGGYDYNHYHNGPYIQTPNAVYIRPDYPYNRPYGNGYSGGIGLPLVGGFLGGALLGGLLF